MIPFYLRVGPFSSMIQIQSFDNLRALFCEWVIGLKFGFYFNLYNL